MSHSKKTKRGQSLFVESWNPSAKRFINVCSLCGAKGYSPTIDEEGFVYTSDGKINYEHRAIQAELSKILSPLPLDELGRCPQCQKMMENR